ncbi:MAG: DUF1810 domain-containing protein [Akkermansiaceae bacterium]|nr:DUF1810 domain-containing protein [Akkermansiaceae bacterium]
MEKFLEAQNDEYEGYGQALSEITRGRKVSHWIWYIFPQIQGLGSSATCRKYALSGAREALDYLNHPTLGNRLMEISRALLKHKGRTPEYILGYVDALKVCSCMTLFDYVCPDSVFAEVLDAFYGGQRCTPTLDILSRQ